MPAGLGLWCKQILGIMRSVRFSEGSLVIMAECSVRSNCFSTRRNLLRKFGVFDMSKMSNKIADFRGYRQFSVCFFKALEAS